MNETPRSISTNAARNLATTSKTLPQMTGVSPRWLLRLLPWVQVSSGTYRVNRRNVLLKEHHRINVDVTGDTASVSRDSLKAMPLLNGAPDEILEKMANHFKPERFEAGQTIVKEGDDGDRFFVIGRGTAEVSVTSEYGSQLRLNILSDGDFFGEMALLRSGKRMATVTAVTSCICVALSAKDFGELTDAAPELVEHFKDSMKRLDKIREQVNEYGEARSEMVSDYQGEAMLEPSFVDYDPNPREYPLSIIQTQLSIHTRVTDLYNEPIHQLTQQLRLTIESMKEQQEMELVNNKDYGLLSHVDSSMRVSTRFGPPTPDDMDELLARVWKEPSFFLAHPSAIAAFGRECTRRGVPPPTVQMGGSPVLTWRGVPIIPSDKLLVNGRRRPMSGGGRTSILLMRVGENDRGVVGLHKTGIDSEHAPSLTVRLMGIDRAAIANYLVTMYFSLAVLADDALGCLDNVEVGNYEEYRR